MFHHGIIEIGKSGGRAGFNKKDKKFDIGLGDSEVLLFHLRKILILLICGSLSDQCRVSGGRISSILLGLCVFLKIFLSKLH